MAEFKRKGQRVCVHLVRPGRCWISVLRRAGLKLNAGRRAFQIEGPESIEACLTQLP